MVTQNLIELAYFIAVIFIMCLGIYFFGMVFSKSRKQIKKDKRKVFAMLVNDKFIFFSLFLLLFNYFLMMIFPWAIYYSKSTNQKVMLALFFFTIGMFTFAFIATVVGKKSIWRK